ncbi:MAG: ParA family protein [Pseudomonadota bacterium]|jgi:chromosome partitioning protein|nr:ParA family protein [Pseudomonadota bacterium]
MSAYNGKTRVIPIVNNKGGSSKSTTCINLGAALAREGKFVLLIDFDAQANLTLSIMKRIGLKGPTVREFIAGKRSLEETTQRYYDNLHIMPATISLHDIEAAMAANYVKLPDSKKHTVNYYLRSALDKIDTVYDYVLIDCSPNAKSFMVKNALAASTEIFIPTTPDILSLRGALFMQEVVRNEILRINPSTGITGVIVSNFIPSRILFNGMLKQIKKRFDPLVFKTTIRNSIKIPEAQGVGMTIFDYKPYSTSGQDFTELAKEVISMEHYISKEKT